MKEMFSTLKLVIDWTCNLNCSYCCNKQKEVIESFTPMTLEEVANSSYMDYELTGGEPLLWQGKLRKVIKHIQRGKGIYLYTNGLFLHWSTAECLQKFGVNGINVGYHNIELNWKVLKDIHRYLIPITLWIQDKDITPDLMKLRFPIHIWTDGDCDDINTDRKVLIGLED